jgi:branched-subunit amino acid transport protein
MSAWIAVALAGVITYLLRIGPVLLLTRYDTPSWTERAGDLVGPVAFAALAASAVASAVPLPAASLMIGVAAGGPKVLGAVAGALVAYRFRSVWAAVGVGMLVMLALKAVPG